MMPTCCGTRKPRMLRLTCPHQPYQAEVGEVRQPLGECFQQPVDGSSSDGLADSPRPFSMGFTSEKNTASSLTTCPASTTATSSGLNIDGHHGSICGWADLKISRRPLLLQRALGHCSYAAEAWYRVGEKGDGRSMCLSFRRRGRHWGLLSKNRDLK